MNQSDIRLRLYKLSLILGICVSVACIIGNYFSKFPFMSDIKWIALLCITIFAFIFSNNEKFSSLIMFGVFIFLICIFLPFAFIDSGGSNNNATGYAFVLLIISTYLFKGWRRVFLISVLILTFIIMHYIEYHFPEIITVYSPKSQYIDRMIQIPLLLFISFFIILQFAKEYELVNHKLNELAKYDELTGLYNRRMFNKEIDKAFKSGNESIHLAFLDLNNFKKVNDKCGHSAGDNALIELSRILQNTFGFDKHIVSRWGGDEFAIIYFGKKDEFIRELDIVNENFSNYVYTYEETAGISISVVSFKDYTSIAEMFNEADIKLYKQKQDFNDLISSGSK